MQNHFIKKGEFFTSVSVSTILFLTLVTKNIVKDSFRAFSPKINQCLFGAGVRVLSLPVFQRTACFSTDVDPSSYCIISLSNATLYVHTRRRKTGSTWPERDILKAEEKFVLFQVLHLCFHTLLDLQRCVPNTFLVLSIFYCSNLK